MTRLSLKTKIVISIVIMVVSVVTILSAYDFSQVVRQRVDDTFQTGEFVSLEVSDSARKALEVDLSNAKSMTDDDFHKFVEESLQTDPGVNSLIASIIGYSPNIYDIAITDVQGHIMLHNDPSQIGSLAPERADFSAVRREGFWRELRVIYGSREIYEVEGSLRRNGQPFALVRVGISTVLLRRTLQPALTNALVFSGISILFSLLLAAIVSNLSLRPLAVISARLDEMSGGAGTHDKPVRSDEYGVVSHKIERLGKQMRDVKEVFSALKENLDQIMANLQDGVMLFSRDSKAILVSASVESFLHKQRAEMLGRDIHEIFAGRPRLGSLVLQAFEQHQPLSQVEVLSDSDEGAAAMRVQVSLDFIAEDGEPVGALLTLRDAESVHRIEDELELSRRLAAVGRLTSGVAHEVKNPINAIVVHLELLRQKMQGAQPDAERHVNVIGSEIRRLDRVVQTLVDFTRPMELRLAEVDLRRVVEEVTMLATPDAEKHGVHVRLDLDPEPLMVKIDVDLVKQAVVNIVINGMQAMQNGGSMDIRVRREGADALLAINDQGSGIPPEIREKIFNLYFTTKSGGSGIGLPMTYRVMQLHNGSMEFESVVGQGTTFHLRLPLADAARSNDRHSLQGTAAAES